MKYSQCYLKLYLKCQKQFDPWKQFIEKNQDSIAKTQHTGIRF